LTIQLPVDNYKPIGTLPVLVCKFIHKTIISHLVQSDSQSREEKDPGRSQAAVQRIIDQTMHTEDDKTCGSLPESRCEI
jgi:hypothetical protein